MALLSPPQPAGMASSCMDWLSSILAAYPFLPLTPCIGPERALCAGGGGGEKRESPSVKQLLLPSPQLFSAPHSDPPIPSSHPPTKPLQACPSFRLWAVLRISPGLPGLLLASEGPVGLTSSPAMARSWGLHCDSPFEQTPALRPQAGPSAGTEPASLPSSSGTPQVGMSPLALFCRGG